jgi:hypothetical protein
MDINLDAYTDWIVRIIFTLLKHAGIDKVIINAILQKDKKLKSIRIDYLVNLKFFVFFFGKFYRSESRNSKC